MIIEFLISTIAVGIIGSIFIYICRSNRKKMEEDLKIKIDELEKIYMEDRLKHNKDIELLRAKLDIIKKEYSTKYGKSKSHILY